MITIKEDHVELSLSTQSGDVYLTFDNEFKCIDRIDINSSDECNKESIDLSNISEDALIEFFKQSINMLEVGE